MAKLCVIHRLTREEFFKENYKSVSLCIELLMRWAILHPEQAFEIAENAIKLDELRFGPKPMEACIHWKEDDERVLVYKQFKEVCLFNHKRHTKIIRGLISARGSHKSFDNIPEVYEWKLMS